MTKKEIAQMAKDHSGMTVEQRKGSMESLGLSAKDIKDVEAYIAQEEKINADLPEAAADEVPEEEEETPAPAPAPDKKAKKGKAEPNTLNKRYKAVRLVREGNKLLEGPVLRENVKLTEDRVERLNNKAHSTMLKYVLM